jgi:DNA-binding LacI/PurR family transcriptional regulator
VPHTTFTNLQDIVEVISADLDELGFTVVVHFRVSEAEREVSARLHHLVDTLRPAGVIDLGGMSRRDVEVLEAAGCPVLPPSAEPESDGNIWIGRLQVEHLRARGHTRIAYAFLSDPREDAYGQTRARAAAEACAQAGLPPPVHTQVPLEGNASEAVLRDLLARTGVPLGVAAFNDEVAMALVSAAARLGVAVPGELAVVGVERSSVGQLVSPRLTTVSVDVPASLRHIRQSIASTYSGPTHPETATPFADVFTILDGETT